MKLTDFKVMGQDEHSYTIGHPKGKTIKVPKQGLSELAKKKIQMMAEGGSVEDPIPNKTWATDDPVADYRSLSDDSPSHESPEQLDRLSQYETGANRSPAGASGSWGSDGQWYQPDAGFFKNTGNLLRKSIGDVKDAVVNVAEPIGAAVSDFSSGLTGQPAGAANAPQSAEPPPSNYNLTPTRQPAGPASPGMDMSGYQAGYNQMIQGGKEEIQGANQAAAAEGQLGQQRAKLDEQHVKDVQAAQSTYQQNFDQMTNEYKSAMEDVQKGHIDPNHYYESKSTAGKVATSIGLILGGIGGGLTGKENPALAFLNKQMDRDIESQKADLGKKETLLSANLKQFGNLHQATLMTQAMQAGIYTSQLDSAAAKSADPLAKARALAISGDIKAKVIGPAMQQLAQSKMMMQMMGAANSGQQGNPERVLNVMRTFAPERAKELESRYVPGVGIAAIPIPEKERESIVKLDQFSKQLNDAINFHKKVGGGAAALTPQNRAVGKSMTNGLITSLNDLKGLNRFTGEEARLYEDIVGNVGSVDVTGGTAKKLQQLQKELGNKKSVLYKQFGLPVPAQFHPSN